MDSPQKAPKHLRAATRRWFESITGEFVLEEHHLKTLLAAAQQWDRAEEARLRVAADGAYVLDRFGQLRVHPGVAVERDALTLYARLLRELQLDVPSPDERPPRITSRGVA